ncbi:MAG: ABC-F family ATP-binding cassette domain-containing protein [Pseudomonadota bacterium]|nr:ABC-F family ATP-binding cassette domain-containing protein [Pseudomonadota bacterium]
MSASLTLSDLSLATPDARPLVSGLTLSFGVERTGIVGRNGCGKSTLLHVMAGSMPPASGEVSVTGQLALMEQQACTDAESLADALGVGEAQARLARILDGTASEADLDAADWTLETRVEAVLARVGLPAWPLDRPAEAASGGQRTRLAIARMLLAEPDILLLDEPTNNLDADGRAAIFELIGTWPGGIVVASHDRDLLERMDRIVELTPVGATVTGGGWSAFAAGRTARRSRIESEAERAEAALRQARLSARQRSERKARSDRAGRKERASGSQPKVLLDAKKNRAEGSDGQISRTSARQVEAADARLEAARGQVEIVTPLHVDLPACGLGAGQRVLEVRDLVFSRAGVRILGPLDVSLTGPERVAVTGPNGSGKSTLFDLVTGRLEPEQGSIVADRTRIALLDQSVSLLDPALSVVGNGRRLNPGLDENTLRAALARYAFRAGAAEKPAGVLSGGERMRAGLACLACAATPPRLLVLDEPTNHVDLEAVELLERALAGYDGAILVASHDTRFLDAIGVDRRIELGAGGALR